MQQRPFRGLGDLAKMKSLLSEILRQRPNSTIHPGDLDWRLFVVSAAANPDDLLRLWEQDGQLAGFMFAYQYVGHVDLILRPEVSGTSAEEQMLTDVEQHLAVLEAKIARRLSMFVFADDTYRRELLDRRGYTGQDLRVHFARSITGDPIVPSLPQGFSFMSQQDGDYAAKRAQLHVDAFNPGSTMTTGKYRAIMGAPGYKPELDVVITAPDGQLAAFALAWIDPVSKVGLFEPVGTHPQFQRLGLGKAALDEGMRRMRARGMETATVRTSPQLTGVIPFYQAAGFDIANTIWSYTPPP